MFIVAHKPTVIVIAESVTGVSPLSAPLLEEVDIGVLQGDGAGGLQQAGAACTARREGRVKEGGGLESRKGGRTRPETGANVWKWLRRDQCLKRLC